MLRRWGNLGGIVLSTPAPLEDLCLLALQDPRSGWAEADGAQLDLARDAAALLAEKAEMLDPNPNPAISHPLCSYITQKPYDPNSTQKASPCACTSFLIGMGRARRRRLAP